MSHKLFSSLMIVLIITACAPAAPTPGPTTTSIPATPVPLDEKIDVGGYSLRIICTGQGAPTVVVDAAFAEAALESGIWMTTRYAVEKTTRFCLYDRAGLGSSDAAPNKLRTSQDMVNDLHTLLVNANVAGPYVLVGHNVGGFIVRLYASQYPDEVDGIVVVDSLHPDYESETLAVLPPEAPGETGILRVMRNGGFYPDPDMNIESIDFATSAAQVQAAGSLGDLPLVVLNSGSAWLGFPDLSPNVQADMEQVWQDLQVDLVSLSSNSTHITATEQYSSILVNEPELVIDAILKVVNEAKSKTLTVTQKTVFCSKGDCV